MENEKQAIEIPETPNLPIRDVVYPIYDIAPVCGAGPFHQGGG